MTSFAQLKQQVMDAINNQPSVIQLRQWYQAQNERDKNLLKMLFTFLLVLLFYLLIISPALQSNQSAKAALSKNIQLYNLIADNAHRFGQVGSTNSTQTSLLSVISQQAQQRGLSLNRYEQSDQAVKIWLEDVSFDQVMDWLEDLKISSNIMVKQINVDKQTLSGRVSVRATLSR